MKILVTGGFGFIGSHVVERLVALGHDVMVVDDLCYSGRSANLQGVCDFTHVKADICDALAINEVFAAFQPEAVMHLAAETHVERSLTCSSEFLRTNVDGTHVMLEACVRHGKPRFLHVSTDEVYGSLGPCDKPWNERSPYRPRNPYAASKAASDCMVSAYAGTFDLDTVVCHSANNYGPRQHPEKVIPTFVRQCLAGKPMTVHGDGMNRRDWIHVGDNADLLIHALFHGLPGHTYNIPGTKELSNLDLAKAIGKAVCHFTARESEIIHVPDRPGNDRRYAMDGFKIHNTLPRVLRTEFNLAPTVQWYINNPTYADGYGR